VKTIIINNTEYETETHDLGKELGKIKIPRGWQLWNYDDCLRFSYSRFKKELNLEDCWFFIEHPSKSKKLIAWFCGDSYGFMLGCSNYSSLSDCATLGVRFKRRISEEEIIERRKRNG
jgi:hypothetical protein